MEDGDHSKASEKEFHSINSKNSGSAYFVLNPQNVKRLNREHAKSIANLLNDEVTRLFGEIESTEEIVLTRFLTLGIEDEHGHLVGVITLHNSPNVPSVPPSEWVGWLKSLYGLRCNQTRNVFWIHFLAYDPKYEMFFVRPILHYMFKIISNLEFLLFILPPGVEKVDCMVEFTTRILPKECSTNSKTQSLLKVNRESIMVTYKIRRAVEEDNDDLVPLINLYSKRLVELYGHYYIAELLTRHKDCGRHIIVAEYQGAAVSVMILNDIVNHDLLNEEFELLPFHGLRKKTEEDNIELDSLSHIDLINFGEPDYAEDLEDDRKPDGLSDVTICEDEFLVNISDIDSEYSLVFTSSDLFVFDEDEVEDKEMVNRDLARMESSATTSLEILKGMEKAKSYEVDPRLAYADMMEKDMRSISSRSKLKLPKFFGESNAFCIEVAATHADHNIGLYYLLEAAFECFPDRDYVVISLPSSCSVEHWMSRFNRVTPRPTSNYTYDLFVCHKISLLGTVECQVATHHHMPEVYTLLSTIPTRAIVLSHFEIFMEFENSPYQCFVFLCEGHVIGTAVLSEEHNIDYIDTQYDISHWVPLTVFKSGTFGVIESLVISPIFHNVGRFFKRELHRLSDYQVLFYKHKSYDKGTYKERPVASLLHWMQPILPRIMPNYDLKMFSEEGYCVNEALLRRDHYALYLSTISQSSIHRYQINTKIVVVGCSNTAYAFLESLLLRTHNLNYMVSFNNVTLVCPDDIHQKLPKKVKELFTLQKNFMTERYMDMISLKTYVNVVSSAITQINRKERYIVLNDQQSLRYDLLFLMCGETFQKPLHEYRLPFAENPENVFLINGPAEGNRAIVKLKQLRKGEYNEEKIIVYGHFLQAYSCLEALLEYGIPGSKIVLVEPFPYMMNIDRKRRHNVSVFNDPDVYNATMEFIEAQGIQVCSSCYFINWTYNSEENIVTSVKFESKHKMLELSCQAVFFFDDKSISPKIYQVINQAGLVFDGRLVVDNNCRTNDERIYGAGTLTKYSRRYFATNLAHKYFNRVEIGRKLGQQIRNMLVPGFVKRSDPKKHGWNFHMDIRDRLVPKYEKPLMRYCRLPGGLYYLSVVKPGRRIPLEAASSMENYGQVLVTGNCKNLDHQGFFKLHFNEYSRVETITCLTKFPIDVKNIYCLWGKHEKLLNNLQLRFEMIMISDFFEYFKQPWAYAVYHDRFDQLLNELNNIMTSSVSNEDECLITDIIEMYKTRKWQPLTNEQQDEIERKFPSMTYPKIIEQKVLDFIQDNLNYLPMYAHPLVVRSILEGFDKSPLFYK